MYLFQMLRNFSCICYRGWCGGVDRLLPSACAGPRPRERFHRNHDGVPRPLCTHHCLGAPSWPRSCGL